MPSLVAISVVLVSALAKEKKTERERKKKKPKKRRGDCRGVAAGPAGEGLRWRRTVIREAVHGAA